MTDYMTVSTNLPPYLPYPRFLLTSSLTQTARLIFAVLLDRATLSQANGWADENGRLFVVFPLASIANAIGRSAGTVKTGLNELETAGLIERKRSRFSMPNRIYLKLPDGKDSVQRTVRKPTISELENCPTAGQKTAPMMVRKLSTNNLSINNLRNNDLSRTRETRARGRYANVLLTEDEYWELSSEIPCIDRLVEELSGYMKSSGRTYADHAATLRRWAQREAPKSAMPDYSCEDGESL